MAIQPTGRVVRDRRGLDLILERRMPVPAAEAWDWFTTPALLKKWIGTYRGKPALGAEVTFTMTFEEGSGGSAVTILACEPQTRLTVRWVVGGDLWEVSVSFAELDGATTVFFDQRLSSAREAGLIGPGWEFYLDCLLAAIDGTPRPEFDEYLATQQPYYERVAMDGDPISWPPS